METKTIELLQSLNSKVDILTKQLTTIPFTQSKQSTVKYGGMEVPQSITGYSKNYIYKLCHLKLIPHVKRGSKLFFNAEELERWIEQGGKVFTKDEQLQSATESLSKSVKKSRNKAA
jgi:excisionase family DNA binding protein